MARKKKRSVILRLISALLTLVLLAVFAVAGLGVYLFLAMKDTEVGTLDLAAELETAPLPREQRFTVEDGFGVRMTLGDLVLHLTKGLVEPELLQKELEEQIGNLGVELSAYDLRLTAEGIALDAATEWNGIRIAGTVLCTLETGEELAVVPTHVCIGKLKIPVEPVKRLLARFGVGLPELRYPIGKSLCAFVTSVERVDHEEGCLLVRGPWETGTLAAFRPSLGGETDPAYGCAVWYSDEYRPVMDGIALMDAGRPEEAVEAVLAGVRRGGMNMCDVYEVLLGLQERRHYAPTYLLTEGDLIWAIPDLTVDSANARTDELERVCRDRDLIVRELYNAVYAAQKGGRITVKDGTFRLGSKEFRAEDLTEAFANQDFLTSEDIELCVNLLPAADVRGLRKLSALSDGRDSFSGTVYTDMALPFAVIVRTRDGGHVVYYRTYGITEREGWKAIDRTQVIPDSIYEECTAEGKATVLRNW